MTFVSVSVAVLAILAGAAVTLMAIIFMLAGGANLQPEAAARHVRWMWALGLTGLAFAVVAAALLTTGRPWWAAAVGAGPVAALAIVVMVYFVMEVFNNG